MQKNRFELRRRAEKLDRLEVSSEAELIIAAEELRALVAAAKNVTPILK